MNKTESLQALQQVKCFLQSLVIDAQQAPTIITAYLKLLDQVQLYIEPNLDINKLQEQIEKTK